MVSFEERLILDFLRASPTVFFSAAEISRRAGGHRKFTENPHWAQTHLNHLFDKRLVQRDAQGHYRLVAGA
jgi:hypothetical protein